MSGAGIPSDHISGIDWDAAVITLDAIRKLGTNATAEQIRDFIESQSHYPGILGTYDFRKGNHHGLNQDDLLIVRYDHATSTWKSVSKFGGMPAR